MSYHGAHHNFINSQLKNNKTQRWHWNNLFLVNDNYKSTIDLWITEVLPTLVFCYLTGHYWIFIFYYFWASLIQESIEHNYGVNLYPFLTSGKWHLLHHGSPNKNFGVFFPIWDIIFGTNKNE